VPAPIEVYNPPVAALQPGVPFPSVRLLDAKGRPAARTGGPTLYAFFKTTCPTCILSWPYLERIRAAGEGGTFRVVAVSQDDPDATKDFNARHGSRVETLFDPRPWPTSDAVGLTNVPTFFLVDESGTIRETIVGFHKEKIDELGALAARDAGRPEASVFRLDERVPDFKPG
jgi:peroxiredoxin